MFSFSENQPSHGVSPVVVVIDDWPITDLFDEISSDFFDN